MTEVHARSQTQRRVLTGDPKARKPPKPAKKLRYVLVRSSAGVFAGELKSRKGHEVVLLNARRIWQWAGAASLSQMAVEGVKLPGECRFPVEVPLVELLDVSEILDVSEAARRSIAGVPIWQA